MASDPFRTSLSATLVGFIACTAALAQEGARCADSLQASPFVPRSEFECTADFTADPVPQIQAHLARVVARLEAATTEGLTDETRSRRRAMIATLADYAAAAEFPVNTITGIPTPIFIDDDGRACAVGHLMIESGARDLAERIRVEANLEYVPDITVPGAADWMAHVGLSVDECALIQPAYGPCGNFNAIIGHSPTCTPTVPNSLGWVATMAACGSTNVSDNNVFLLVQGLPGSTVGYFLNARDRGQPVQIGSSQGSLCLSGDIGRHDRDIFTSSLTVPLQGWAGGAIVDVTQMPTPMGFASVVPGDTWYFQAWYRDANPTPTSNLSDVIAITFT